MSQSLFTWCTSVQYLMLRWPRSNGIFGSGKSSGGNIPPTHTLTLNTPPSYRGQIVWQQTNFQWHRLRRCRAATEILFIRPQWINILFGQMLHLTAYDMMWNYPKSWSTQLLLSFTRIRNSKLSRFRRWDNSRFVIFPLTNHFLK